MNIVDAADGNMADLDGDDCIQHTQLPLGKLGLCDALSLRGLTMSAWAGSTADALEQLSGKRAGKLVLDEMSGIAWLVHCNDRGTPKQNVGTDGAKLASRHTVYGL